MIGNFPYVVHGEACVASFANIVKYVEGILRPRQGASGLGDHGDEEEGNGIVAGSTLQDELSAKQRAQEMAWLAFVFARLGDLVVSRSPTALPHLSFPFSDHLSVFQNAPISSRPARSLHSGTTTRTLLGQLLPASFLSRSDIMSRTGYATHINQG